MGSLGDNEKRLFFITRRIPEENVYGLDLIKDALAVEGRSPRCLWGMTNLCFSCESIDLTCMTATAPTGKREPRFCSQDRVVRALR